MRPNEMFNNMLKSRTANFYIEGGVESFIGSESLITLSSSGSIIVHGTGSIRLLVVGGGAGGAGPSTAANGNRGGGAGGVVSQTVTVSPGTYTVVVGSGGGVGIAGGLSKITGVSSIASGGSTNGNSGNGYTVGAGNTIADSPSLGEVMSGGGAGSAQNGFKGVTASGAISSSGGGGDAVVDDITGSFVSYGFGGYGGSYWSTKSYTDYTQGVAGYIDYNGGSPVSVNAQVLTGNGNGGSGGGRAGTPLKSANASSGTNGIIYIRYTKI